MIIYLYKNSLNEARATDNLASWKESQAENIRCKDSIEKSNAEHFNDNHLDSAGAKKIIAEFGNDRTMWVLAASVVCKDYDGRFSRENKDWAKSIIPNYLPKEEFQYYAVDSHPALLDGFINQIHREYAALELVSNKQCLQKSSDMNFEKQLLILKPDVLSEQYKNPVNQYFYVTGGFGCDPEKSGRKVFGYFLADSEKTHFYREDFIGVADQNQLPEWATEKLQEIENPTMKIRIYQIEHELDKNGVRYESYEKTFKYADKINPSIYRQGYGGEVQCRDLESVFRKFNEDYAPGFFGESMSISNVIEVCDGKLKGTYFCDSVGFKKIDFDTEQTIRDDIIKVLIFEPRKEPYEAEIRNNLKAMRSVVGGGSIEVVHLFDDNAFIYCNDEYRLHDFEGNRYVEGVPFAGNFMIIGDAGNGENCSLTEDQIERYAEEYREPNLTITQEVLEEDMEITFTAW